MMTKNYFSDWTKLWYVLSGILLVTALCSHVQAQTANYTISGLVTDGRTGSPLSGVAVRLEGTNAAASTDDNGQFTITTSVAAGTHTVSFSSVGYSRQAQTVEFGSATSVRVDAQLAQDVVGLDEVIVTGTSAGTTRRQLGNYVGSVSAEELTKGAAGNVLTGLQGKVAGAQITQNQGDPAGGISVRLRGISSISSSSEPLYIIDGVIANNSTSSVTDNQQNRLVDINPADIERIEILNGAAAAAIYGSRANAGVVQIFTKRGTTGKPSVTFSTTLMANQVRKKLPMNMAPIKFGGPTDGPGAFTQDLITAPLQTTTTEVTRYDYQDYIFRNAFGTDNNVSIAGGTEGTKYYASASYFDNQGIIQNTDYTRFGLRANLDQVLTDWATVRAGINYVRSDANEKPYGNGLVTPIGSQWIIANFHNIWERDELGNLKAVGERGRVNPVSIIEDFKQRQGNNRVLANLGVKLTPIENLIIDYNVGVDNSSAIGTLLVPPYTYNVSTGSYGGGPTLDPSLNGYARKVAASQYMFNTDLNITYNVDISDKWASTSQLGYSYQYQNETASEVNGRGLAPFVETVEGASTPGQSQDNRSEFSVAGGYFQQTFKYDNQLFITGAVRLDGSSMFGVDQRNQVYLKGSGSYVVSSTRFWENMAVSSWWDLLKLRLAYGESGNLTGIGAYDRFNAYSTLSYLGKTSFSSSFVQANETVKPERQRELEYGADLSFLQNRLGLTVNVYHKKVTDMLLNRQVAPTTGFTSRLDNFGSMQNNGFELLLQVAPVRNTNWNWDMTFIYNRNRNKALNIGEGVTFFTPGSSAPVAIVNGEPVGIFYGTYFARDENGELLLTPSGAPQTERGVQSDLLNPTPQRDENGQPTGEVLRKVIGNPNPDWSGSFVSEVSYKRLSFRVQFDTQQGGNMWNADWRTAQGVGSGKISEMEYLGQLPRGYIAGAYNVEEWRVHQGSFVKLRDVSFAYTFNNLKPFSSLTVNVSGRNLYSWDNYVGYDPEVNSSGQSTLQRGIDFSAVPLPRSFNLGIQAKF